jgi:hypothetical protein
LIEQKRRTQSGVFHFWWCFFHNVISVAQTALAIRLHDPFAPSICSIDVYQRLSAGDPDSGSPNDVRAFHGS